MNTVQLNLELFLLFSEIHTTSTIKRVLFGFVLFLGDVVVGDAGGSANLGEAWQRGCNAWGVRGLFPTSCVKELNLSGRSRQLSERSALAQALELPPYALGQARALMSLHAQLNEELDFREGDLIMITGLPEPGWFQGELEGRRGIFPEGFVELIAPLRSPQEPVDCQYLNNDPQQIYKDAYDEGEGAEEEGMEDGEVFHGEKQQNEVLVQEEHEDEDGVYGVALYEFRAMEPGELDFDVGDRIRIVNTLEDGWLEGELRGQRGIFPHRFVKIEVNEEKNADEVSVVGPEAVMENECIEESTNHKYPNNSENDPEWRVYEDHTVWDLDYFEMTEEKRWHCEHKSDMDETVLREQRKEITRTESQPPRPSPPSHRPKRKSTPPARPRLPPRPSPPTPHQRQHVGQRSNGNPSTYSNGNVRPVQPRRTQSLVLHNSQSGWSKDKAYSQRPPTDSTSTNIKSPSLSQALNTIVEGHKQQKLTRHCSMSDAGLKRSVEARPRPQQRSRVANGILPASITLEALAASASDLEAKLSQQLFEFEKSLPSSHGDTNMSSSCSTDISSPADLNSQSLISRHFSILKYSDENDIIRGSSHSPVPDSNYSSLERPRHLRPPPPRPRVLRPPAPAPHKPTRPAPRPPPRCPRQNATRPSSNAPTNNPIFYAPDEPATTVPDEGRVEFGDPTPTHEHEIQDPLDGEQELDREIELESERQKEEEENYQLLLRLQEVENEMEDYAHTVEELRAMLEEEEDETVRLQTLENLEFCNYTLETLALEQQQLQGKTEKGFGS